MRRISAFSNSCIPPRRSCYNVLGQLHRFALDGRLRASLLFGATVPFLQRTAPLREFGPASLASRRPDAQRRAALAAGTVRVTVAVGTLWLLPGPGRSAAPPRLFFGGGSIVADYAV